MNKDYSKKCKYCNRKVSEFEDYCSQKCLKKACNADALIPKPKELCKTCRQVKEFTEFNKGSICKLCANESQRAVYEMKQGIKVNFNNVIALMFSYIRAWEKPQKSKVEFECIYHDFKKILKGADVLGKRGLE